MKLHSGVIAATVTWPKGSDEDIELWWGKKPDTEGVILFGASDLLQITSNVFHFGRSADKTSSTEHTFDTDDIKGRTANTYLAAKLADVHETASPGLFRAFSFLRAQRPQYERLTSEILQELLDSFAPICKDQKVSCRVLLGYGWADLYLDLSGETLDELFAAIVGCRAVTRESHGVFQNAFTIVGVDWRRRNEAEHSNDLVRPQMSLRVAPSELEDFILNRLPLKSENGWDVSVTSGKRDIFITRRDSVRFGDFWIAHRDLRRQIGRDGFPVHKMETHFDFVPEKVFLPKGRETAQPDRCRCSLDGNAVEEKFVEGANQCTMMGPGLLHSFEGLAHLYREALDGGESCCDFDAAAAHFFSQRRLFEEYQKLCEQSQEIDDPDTAEAQRTRRRRYLLRDAIERLEVSSVFIFNQEQNGSYSDLLSRSERVSLYRGGMQKINVALLTAIDSLIDRLELPILPMLCWWPAGQIQSERPTGVIKVPVFYLHQPELAFFLIIHELGQLVAHARDWAKPLPPREYKISDFRLMAEQEIRLGTAQEAESLGVDAGKFITDLRADVFLLRVGFSDDVAQWRRFVFDQFLKLVRAEHDPTNLPERCIQFVTRLICITVVSARFQDRERDNPPWFVLTKVDRRNAVSEAVRQLTEDLDARVVKGEFDEDDSMAIARALGDHGVIAEACDRTADYHEWVSEAIEYVDPMAAAREAPDEIIASVKEGSLTSIDAAQITSCFRALLRMNEDAAGEQALFLGRAALISSILGYCERNPRLPKELVRP